VLAGYSGGGFAVVIGAAAVVGDARGLTTADQIGGAGRFVTSPGFPHGSVAHRKSVV
jgi:hypothetical protein